MTTNSGLGFFIFYFLFVIDNFVFANMSCLVMRPGYGLVSEECPSHAVGCRIRARHDHIEWYELSRLYDRNQLVCVYPEEYQSLTGCMKKPTGSVRCWCGGRKNCNNPETSRDLYEAFAEKNEGAVRKIGEWLKTTNDETWKSAETPSSTSRTTTPTMTTTTTTTTKTTTTRKIVTPKKIVTTTKPTTTTTIKTTSLNPTTTTKKPEKRIGMSKENVAIAVMNEQKPRVINIVDIRDKGIQLKNDDISLDSSFEETRKKLEKDMKEEDERLREMLADEEEEEEADFSQDIDNNEITAEDQREEERRRYRMERRRVDEDQRKSDEEDVLRKIEEEEIREAERERTNRHTKNDDFYGDSYENTSTFPIIFSVIFISFFKYLW